jgi:hypothetical protein
MDRAQGGLEKYVKRNGDWTRYTVVKIQEVKLDYTPTNGQAVAWDSASKEFYINVKTDPDGRKVKIAAKLTKPLKNVVLHFMLAPDKNNRKQANWGVDMPTAWKWKDVTKDIKHLDKTDRKDFLHVSEKTDADGKAAKELTLSRVGGDVFWPAAYIEQDPHLAKYADVDGYPQLKLRKPVLGTDEIKVWRKFWYQMIAITGRTNPDIGTVEGQFERVKARMAKAADVTIANPATVSTYPAVYPRYMFELNGGNDSVLIMTDKNKDDFFSSITPAADMPVKIPLIICDFQWDSDGNADALAFTWQPANNNPIVLTASKRIAKPALQGGDLVKAGAQMKARAPASDGSGGWINGPTVALTDADVDIDPARTSFNQVKLNIPATIQQFINTNPNAEIQLSGLKLRAAIGEYLGEWARDNRTLLAVYNPAQPIDSRNSVAHELGHAFEIVPGFPGRAAPNTLPLDIPQHANRYESAGWHCNNGGDTCIMYESGVAEGHSINRFCDVCHPYLLVRNMDAPNKPG